MNETQLKLALNLYEQAREENQLNEEYLLMVYALGEEIPVGLDGSYRLILEVGALCIERTESEPIEGSEPLTSTVKYGLRILPYEAIAQIKIIRRYEILGENSND